MKLNMTVRWKSPYINSCFISLALFTTACHVDREASVRTDPEVREVRCDSSGYFIDNLCEDEKEYLDWAAAFPEYPEFGDLDQQALRTVTKETLDPDKAAALFYQRGIQVPRNRAFYEYLNRKEKVLREQLPDYSDRNVLFAVVPGMFYKDNPTIGADGAQIRRLAAQLGLKQDLVEVEQTGTVAENAQFICDYVKSRTDVNAIILASVSKGSGDIKKALQICGEDPGFQKVIGWFNIGGINKGTLLINEIENHWNYKLEARSYFCWNGYDWDGFLSMRAGPDAPLNFEIDIPDHILLINVIAVPIYRFVTERAKPYWLHLAQFGPNDGMSLLADLTIPEGITWLSWRNDHYFRNAIPESKMQAFIVYILEQQNNRY
ncbi:MAG: hypothetical protein KDK30_06455 [Leptospiraceae bacterium]|nr:hypothetical protein [Leptospiraceae bacterium]MCB1315759.1 hypothetical protein [Leptospiraceae bacterium]